MDKLSQKLQNLPHRMLIFVLVSFAVGVLVSSLYWQNKTKDAQSSSDYRNFEIKNLQEQIASLRENNYKITYPSPTPSPVPYVKKDNLSSENTYKLTCFDSQEIKNQKPDYVWMNKLISKLPKESQLVSLCYNKDLNAAVIISSLPGTQRSYPIELSVYYIAENFLALISKTSGSWLGSCKKFSAWTKTNQIYYQCNAGDGAWGTTTTYKVDLSSLSNVKVGITESCYSYPDKTSCTNFCESSSDCQNGAFCNLENKSCVQSCKTGKDCVNSACRPFGPVMGCLQ